MENEDASHKYAPLFDVYHHLLIVPRIFDCFNQRFPSFFTFLFLAVFALPYKYIGNLIHL